MRKLNRNHVLVPTCLASYQPGRHCWDHVSHADKQQIHRHLEQMQGRRCAYCEGALDELGQHIEHFRCKHVFCQLTFTWTNLYWSCGQNDSCGHYKDNGAKPYNPNDLIDPCIDDPDRFFRFRSNGSIDVRSNLSPQEKHRAGETLRVFNLHPEHGRLRNMRKKAASTYIGLVDDLSVLSDQEREDYIRHEIQASAGEPFCTVIRHLFEEIL